MPPSCKGWTHKQLQKLSKLGRIFQGLREGEWVRRRVPLRVAWSYSILHSFFFPLSPSPQSPWGQKNTCICGKHDFNRCSEISSDCIVRCALWFQHYHWYLLPLGLLSSLSNRMTFPQSQGWQENQSGCERVDGIPGPWWVAGISWVQCSPLPGSVFWGWGQTFANLFPLPEGCFCATLWFSSAMGNLSFFYWLPTPISIALATLPDPNHHHSRDYLPLHRWF